MRHLLQQYTKFEWRVASSKNGEKISRYVVAGNSLIFSLIAKTFMSQSVDNGYAPSWLFILNESPRLNDGVEDEQQEDGEDYEDTQKSCAQKNF